MSSDLLALAHEKLRAGRTGEAIDAFRRALLVQPEAADIWFNFAWAQRAGRQFEAALKSYQRAIDLDVARPEEARLNRAVILFDHLQRSDLALVELDAAIAANPDFVEAWLNLGNVREELGQPDLATAAYRRALAIAPVNGRALARLGVIETMRGKADVAVADLSSALALPVSLQDRAEILFALGGALDATGKWDAAFQAIEAANWIAGSISSTRYDRRAQEQLVDRLITAYPAPPAAVAGTDGAKTPLFICGMFRSGSTLVEQILARHSAIHAGGELELIPAMVDELQPYPLTAANLSAEQASVLRARYLRESPAGSLVTDKRCDNFLHIGLIKTLFPEARIVHTKRQPLDNLLSVYFLYFGEAIGYSHDLGDAAHFYREYRRLMDHWKRVFPDDIIDLDYDRLVAAPRAEVEPVLAALGLPWEEACLAVGASSDAVRTASAWQVRRAVHGRSSGRWRNYQTYMDAVRKMLGSIDGSDVTP